MKPAAERLTHTEAGDEERQQPLSLRLVLRILRCALPYRGKLALLLLCVLLRMAQIPLVGWLCWWVLKGPVTDKDWNAILWGGGALLGFMVFTQATMYWRMRLAQELGEAVVRDLRQAVFEHLQGMPMAWFDRTKVGRIISRVSSDCENVRTGVQTVLFVTLVAGGNMLVAAVTLAIANPPLFLVVLAAAPLLWWVSVRFHGRLSGAYRRQQESYARMTATVAESVAGIRVTQSFVRQPVNRALFADLMDEHSANIQRSERLRAVFLPSVELVGQCILAAVLLLGTWQIAGGGFGAAMVGGQAVVLASLVLYALNLPDFINPLRIVAQQYNEALSSMASAERVFDLLDHPPVRLDPPDAAPLPPITGRVEYRGVGFAYRPDQPVLEDISFDIVPGQTVALVGHTGSGKTTITSLLLKHYLPTHGRILLDGVDIRGATTASLVAQTAIVTQNNFLFSGTVADNIRVAKPGAGDADILAAAAALGVADILAALPEGLATKVGERGTALSLGQRQVVCMVRALIKDPRLLILDEATASMDTLTEQRLQAALGRLLAGRTSFVIAHRLSTIRNADLLLVLDHGRLVESGRHADLLAKGGHYANLHRQFVGE